MKKAADEISFVSYTDLFYLTAAEGGDGIKPGA